MERFGRQQVQRTGQQPVGQKQVRRARSGFSEAKQFRRTGFRLGVSKMLAGTLVAERILLFYTNNNNLSGGPYDLPRKEMFLFARNPLKNYKHPANTKVHFVVRSFFRVPHGYH